MEDKKEEQKTEDVMDKKVTDGADASSSAKADEGNSKTEEKADHRQPEDKKEKEEAGEKTGENKEAGSKTDDGADKSGFFKKKKDKKDEKIEELNNRYLRQLAEFDNYRKRTEKEKSAMFEVGARSVIEKILPVVDNFERGLAAVSDKDDPFVQGMEKTYKQLMTTLESMDVRTIDAKGKPFDPNLHNAVMHVEDESLGENIVAEELQKGYTYRGQVVRHSMVKVAN